MIRTEIDSLPAELDAIRRRLVQLEIEKEALTREKDESSKKKLEALEKEYSELKAKNDEMTAKFDREKGAILKLKELKAKLDEARGNLEAAQRQYDYNKAAEIQYGEIPSLEAAIEQMEIEVRENYEGALLKEEVTEEEVSQVLSRWTGIPVSNLLEGEREKLLRLEDEMQKRVIGQEEAITSVTSAILRARAGLKDINRPIGSFIFLGPTGVGKTELAKTLARNLFDSEDNIIRIDMSEYMEKHAVSRLVGAPPGYVGYEEGGQLTEAVRRKPYSVILFDEIEKAHEDVFNMFLQILDMQIREEVMNEMKMRFKPEFLNRVDDIIMFKPLSEAGITKIIDIFVNEVSNRLKDRNISLDITAEAKHILAVEGYDPIYGARPLKRYIQNTLENKLARLIIAGEINYGSHVIIDGKDDEIIIKTE